MPLTLQQPSDVPSAVLIEVTSPLDLPQEAAQMAGSLGALLRGGEGDALDLIVDTSQVEVSLSDLMLALAAIGQEWEKLGQPQDVQRRVRLGVVGPNDPIRLVVDGLQPGQFGIQRVMTFQTTGEALAYAGRAWMVTEVLKSTVSRSRKSLDLEGSLLG